MMGEIVSRILGVFIHAPLSHHGWINDWSNIGYVIEIKKTMLSHWVFSRFT
jgi:hypothetical protein